MSNVEWDIPMQLLSNEGTLLINDLTEPDWYYKMVPEQSESFADLRVSKDDIPQQDGSILHEEFAAGYVIRLTLQYWEQPANGCLPVLQPACEAAATRAHDRLMLHLRSLLNGPTAGRIIYQPTDQDARMWDQLRLAERMQASIQTAAASLVTVTFAVHSPYPYGMDFAETTTTLTDASPTAILDNTGTAPFYPVLRVYGPTDYFEVTNNSVLDNDGNPLTFIYDAAQPGAPSIGGGDYVEIVMFNGTVVLNGDQDSIIAGMVVEESDFWFLAVGPNTITVSGVGTFPAPDTEILWQPAWA